jgi:hypothetical protein
MLKWVWKLYQNAEGLWVDLLKAKYLGDNDIFAAEVPRKGSRFWNSIQKIKWYFKLGAKHRVLDGRRTYFWLDWWSGSGPLRDRFPALFNICSLPFITVRDASDGEGWGILFRRSFSLPEAVECDNLMRDLRLTPTSLGTDGVSWCMEASGVYSARSMYLRLSQGAAVTHFKEVWRTRVPPRIRVFLWQLIRSKLPCSDHVAKWNGPSNGECSLCGELEDCNHIFFNCSLAKFMWAAFRELLHCDWNPAGIGEFLAIAQGLTGAYRRLVWFAFAALCWTLWTIRNKLTIEGSIIGKPADALCKMTIFM